VIASVSPMILGTEIAVDYLIILGYRNRPWLSRSFWKGLLRAGNDPAMVVMLPCSIARIRWHGIWRSNWAGNQRHLVDAYDHTVSSRLLAYWFFWGAGSGRSCDIQLTAVEVG